jgi:hypothetical protein
MRNTGIRQDEQDYQDSADRAGRNLAFSVLSILLISVYFFFNHLAFGAGIRTQLKSSTLRTIKYSRAIAFLRSRIR